MKLVRPISLFQQLTKTSKKAKKRLLGLDVGEKYFGVAVSETNRIIASPLCVLVRNGKNIEAMAGDIKLLASELSLEGIVVGIPYTPTSVSIRPEGARVRCFVYELCKTGVLQGMNYTYWDESFTSKSVEALLSPLDLHPVESKTILDKFAAVGILQAYLDAMNRQCSGQKTEQKAAASD